MKKIVSIVFIILIGIMVAYSQNAPAKSDAKGGGTSGVIKGGVGMSWIKNDKGETVPYYLISLAPEIAFMNFGVGLDLNLYISSKDQSIRWQELQRGRFIRYLRYGNKGDEIYARAGILDYARLGHGSILYNYKNSPSVDNRRIGFEFDYDFEKFGLETIYGDVTDASVLGMRGYVRPLQFTTASSIPVIGGIEVGATFVSDVRGDSRDTGVTITALDTTKSNSGTMSEIGIDLGLPLFRIPWANATLYIDYSKILNFGSGFASGIELNFPLPVVSIFAKYERRFGQTDKYLPSYFDAFYELERYQYSPGKFSSKAKMLEQTISPGPGYFGSLLVDVFGTIQVEGSYQKLDNYPRSGIAHFGTNTGDKIPLIFVSAGYDKRYIINLKDLLTVDDRSLLYAEIGYKPYPFMIVSTVYQWTFAPEKDADGNVIGYKPQKRITPKVSFVFPL